MNERADLMDDQGVRATVDAAIAKIEGVYERAQAAGHLRADVSFLEVQMLSGGLSLTRGRLPPFIDGDLVTRRLAEVLIDGLRAGAHTRQLPESPVGFDDFGEILKLGRNAEKAAAPEE